SDKEITNPINFPEVMSNVNTGITLTKSEMAKQTQQHVEQGRLGSLVLVNESGKGGNPFRQQKSKKRKRRSELGKVELKEKLEEELREVPDQLLKRLLEKAMNGEAIQLETEVPDEAMRSIVKAALAKLDHEDEDHEDADDEEAATEVVKVVP